jgi:hypothetical protein
MDGNRVWGGGRKGVEGVCGEGSLRVRSGLREGTVLAGGRGGLEWGRQRAGKIE